MKILDYKNYTNEKLDIKPMSKTRLGSMASPKKQLESGDCVLVSMENSEILQLFVYVSYSEAAKYRYDHIEGLEKMLSSLNSYGKDGFLIGYVTLIDKLWYLNVGSFDRNFELTDAKVVAILRPKRRMIPFEKDDIKAMDAKKCDIVWVAEPFKKNPKISGNPIDGWQIRNGNPDIDDWDVSSVPNIEDMFSGVQTIKGDIGTWTI
jgi:hypothetical protein